jgi:hypothetical protein
LIRQARAYFVKALTLDERDEVAKEFIETVSPKIARRQRKLTLRSIIRRKLESGVFRLLTGPTRKSISTRKMVWTVMARVTKKVL